MLPGTSKLPIKMHRNSHMHTQAMKRVFKIFEGNVELEHYV